ncbi:MAG TPA: D-glucuronyl C5-epimerase family protein, partial [Candidatus Limnocylindrales bacterium]
MRRAIVALALLVPILSQAALSVPVTATETDEPVPYARRTFSLVDLPYDHLPFTSEPPPALPQAPPATRKGIPLYRWVDGHLYVRPGSVAINGMKRLDAYRDTGDIRQLEQALVLARYLRTARLVRADAWWLPFWFDYAPEGLRAPWFNAMSQGLALSFFSRLYRVTGDDVHRRAAERVFASFRRLGPRQATTVPVPARSWVAYVDERDHLWLEHYPRIGPDHVLNAHLHALNGIYEYWQLTRSAEARQLLEGALTTVRERAGQYRRRDRSSLYGL